MPAGYSGTPLVKKLGIKPGMRARFVSPPDDYDRTLGALPADVTVVRATRGALDFVHLFVKTTADLERRLPPAKAALARDGMVWISWPKKASGVRTDLTGDVVRSAGLASGLVDVKVCAVDDTWSGLKFVYRKKDR
jgi:hypothetical protein